MPPAPPAAAAAAAAVPRESAAAAAPPPPPPPHFDPSLHAQFLDPRRSLGKWTIDSERFCLQRTLGGGSYKEGPSCTSLSLFLLTSPSPRCSFSLSFILSRSLSFSRSTLSFVPSPSPPSSYTHTHSPLALAPSTSLPSPFPLPTHSTHTISAVATAFDRSQNTLVAVAKIRGVFTDINDARRILREIRILRQLKHHRIVNLLEVSVCVCAHFFLPSRSVDHPVNSTFNPPPP